MYDPAGKLHPLCDHYEIVTAGKLQRLSWDGFSFFVYCGTIFNSVFFERLIVDLYHPRYGVTGFEIAPA